MYPRILADSFGHDVNTPCVQKNTTNPNQYVFDNYVLFFTIFRFKCPFIVDDTIDYSTTNRTDKSGKTIFEGDILRLDNVVWVCYWDDGNLEFGLRNDQESIGMAYMAVYDAEIIGNIYETKF